MQVCTIVCVLPVGGRDLEARLAGGGGGAFVGHQSSLKGGK